MCFVEVATVCLRDYIIYALNVQKIPFRSPQSYFPPKNQMDLIFGPPCGVQCGTLTTGDSISTAAAVVQAGGVQGLRARQAIRKALTMNDRHCLQPYKGTQTLGVWCHTRHLSLT